MNKIEFTHLIQNHIDWTDKIENISDVLGISLFESDWIDYPNMLFDKIIEEYFDDTERDTIYWWLYEKRHNPELTIKDSEGDILPSETIDDLWDILNHSV